MPPFAEHENDRISRAIEDGAESRAVEYKSSRPFDQLKWKLVKTCMAMANLEDGGVIVIGVARSAAGGYTLEGIDPDHAGSYDQDILYALVNKHARPAVSLTLRFVSHQGTRFVGIEVAPFERTPIICGLPTPQAAGSDAIRLGEIVGRSRERIATSKIGDPELVAEIIEIAAIKRASEIIATGKAIGMVVPEAAEPQLNQERQDFFEGE